MSILVEPVAHIRPGKAQVFLRPEANVLLREAERLYGRSIYPTGSGSAGRTYEQQLYYWNRYQAGGPVASHPDFGPNPHMRYGTIDIDDQNACQAMLRAGWLATTASEWWHFEHPACRSWPIVTEFHTEEEDMPLPLFYVASSDSPSKIVKANDTWVRSAPGEPLRRLTVGQATDWRTSLGIVDFTSPNLIGKPGTWFDAAFAEDRVVHEQNLLAHPWLAQSAAEVGSLTISLTGTAMPA